MRKLPLLLMFFGIAVLVSAILISTNITNAIIDMSGFAGMNKVCITANSKTADLLFSPRDIKNLEEKLKTEEIGYYALTSTSIKKDNRVFHTKVFGVNPYYKNFIDMDMVSGSFFTYKGEELKYVVVVDANLAWKMFNSIDIVGQKIMLYNRTFEVVGVYRKYKLIDDRSNENIIEKLSNDGLNSLYIPANTLMELDKSIMIDTVFIKTDPEILVGENEKMVSDALQSIGKWTPNYVISDFNENMALLEQKPKIIMFIIGIITVLFIISYVRKTLGKILVIVKTQMASSYFSRIIANNWRILTAQAIKAVMGILLSGIIIFTVKFDLYIPPEYLSDDLIDTKYYNDLLDSKIHEYNQELNVSKSHAKLECDIAEKLTNLQCLLAILIGIPLFHIGIYMLSQEDIQVTKAIVLSACFLVISVIGSLLLSAMMKLPCEVNPRSICVIWAYIFISVVYAIYRKEMNQKFSIGELLFWEGQYE